ncbi:DNA polymerase III subunit alpha [Mycoplasma phocoenae]|uniref:DNA-directed DNA polymerase n=1 Tax=Mycoplasma phocoenae TaxID=754517 RepID=A0A858U224_9MOLU|nr:DNA polymerase III subunit alpha [Mycoplasma phocoenae]QJG67194.1 DNA polymerase III subunit alpha [Mycoplasma phocoenae]
MKLINLHTNTTLSFLESTIDLEELIKLAELNECEYLAITEKGNMFSFARFAILAKEKNIKTIFGLQFNLRIKDKSYQFLAYAQNNKTLKTLFDFNFLHSKQGFVTTEDLTQFNDLVFIDHPTEGYYALTDSYIENLNYYIGLCQYKLDSDELKINLNDKRFLFINEWKANDEFDLKTLNMLYWIKNQSAGTLSYIESINFDINTNVKFIEELISRTNDLAKSLAFEISFDHFKMPVFPNNENIDSFQYLKKQLLKNIPNKLQHIADQQKYMDRLKYELNIIKELGFEDYFLIIWDFIKWAKTNNISIGPGRGSAAGSLVSYILDITQIDPIEYNLLFERFLNPKRVSLPDIDIDVQDDKRGELIQYLVNKYGFNNVATIVTFSTLGTKSAMRDSARAMNIPIPTIDSLAQKIPNSEMSLNEVYENNTSFQNAINNYQLNENGENVLKTAFEEACKIQGFYRQSGTHAAGIIISEENIINKSPVMIANDGLQTQMTMDYLEKFGLLKIDILGLKTLSIISEIVDLIKKHEPEFNIDSIPMNDEKTFNLLTLGKTAGIFQLESPGMIKTLRKVRVDNFNDIVAIISLFRPGPMQYITTYSERKNGNEPVAKIAPIYDEILKSTYGIMIYQEQILEVVQKISKMDYAQADLLRRAISKKKIEQFSQFKNVFIEMSKNNGYTENVIEKIFNDIEKFAEYGFNKSHAVSYATITYRMAYLKRHYPLQFYSAIISSSINSSENMNRYVNEAKELGIEIVSPLIEISSDHSVIKDGKIYLPLNMIKGLGKVGVNNIITERNDNGEFQNLIETILRLRAANIGEAAIKILIKASTFRSYGNQKTLLKALENGSRLMLEIENAFNNKDKTVDWNAINYEVPIEKLAYDYEFESANEYQYLGNIYNSSLTKQYEGEVKLINIHPGTEHVIVVYLNEAVVKISKFNKPFTSVTISDSSATIRLNIWKDSDIKNSVGKLIKATLLKKTDGYFMIKDWKEI